MISIFDRVMTRLEGEEVDESLIDELVQTAKDRICLRVGAAVFPAALSTIAVDVTVKAYRRRYFEGVSSEGVSSSITTSFIADMLAEYERELAMWAATASDSTNRNVVKFL